MLAYGQQSIQDTVQPILTLGNQEDKVTSLLAKKFKGMEQ
jgi:hypothetical protein